MNNNRIRLDDLKREVPFEVPEGYFERLPSIVQSRIPATPSKEPLISWSWGRTVITMGAMSLIAVLVWFTYPERQEAIGMEPLSGVSNSAIIEYLEQENISYYDLSEHQVVQEAFASDSTLLYYLDDLDDEIIRQQLLETIPPTETI